MARIVWLASYPKSGNTWVRFIIAALVRGEIKSSAEVARQVPDIHDGIKGHHLLGQHTTIIKTHWAWRPDLPLREDTIGAIYIVRNPLDVIESNQNYGLLRSGALRESIGEEGIRQRSETLADDFIANCGHARFREFGIGTWEENVASWMAKEISYPRLVIRYEDIGRDPEARIRSIASFLALERTPTEIAAVAARCSKDAMRALEEKEIAARAEGLFYQARNRVALAAGQRFVGRSNGAEAGFQMTEEQRRRALERFATAMSRLGYNPSTEPG